MGTVTLRFYAELNDHLADGVERVVELPVGQNEAVGRLIEECGVQMALVEMILVDGISVPADHRVVPGDRVAVYPVFEAFDVASELRIRDRPLRQTRFTVTPELDGLARLLGEAGYDVDVAPGAVDGRILLTTDPARMEGATHGLLLASSDPQKQLRQVMDRLHLDRP